MKSLGQFVIVAALVSAPLSAFAQSNQPVTRAQVREELVQLHNTGYSPLDDRNSYPTHIQAAEARLAAQQAASTQQSGVGGAANGVSQAGVRADANGITFSHH
ncbi:MULTISPECIES: DUF4148 domain-containing protein [Paraburkholderia]|uniref:Purine nucleoside phosphorylase n=1 Tax=Paraburkholderia largidicola TaxID=3014751 RepID=A0A7I8BT35_9BURK|nr:MULTISPECIES: DUF4148 domain-containing protein [Paraburkholderia]BCF91150.1 hypothetical protein PPGU16_42170 [Paraburkholderia sp. PGU16]CAG9260664.1 conserved exported hypothetical protein [Paraburkholderia caribensis]